MASLASISKLSISLLALTLSTSCQSVANVVFSCGQKPTAEIVQQTLQDHEKVVRQLEAIAPGHVMVEPIEVKRCPGKYQISITHATVRDRKQIKAIVGDTFFGIPYTFFNI